MATGDAGWSDALLETDLSTQRVERERESSQRPAVTSAGCLRALLLVDRELSFLQNTREKKSYCFFNRLLCELTSVSSSRASPLFCRSSCLLQSMSSGDDMSLSKRCNPFKENAKQLPPLPAPSNISTRHENDVPTLLDGSF